MEFKVSAIIPMYKARDYIIENVTNLLNQTLPETEIVIINDCSPDDSMELCRQHFGNNERVQLLDQPKNMGPGAARNRGIEAARGEYITFVDSDDGVLPDAYEKMYNAAKANDADVLHVTGSILPLVKDAPADLLKVSKDDWLSRNMDHFDTTDVLRVITDDPYERFQNWKKGAYHWSVWSKLYRREMMMKYNIRFGDMKLAEDMVFCFGCLFHSRKYVQYPGAFYLYRMSGESLCRGNDRYKLLSRALLSAFEASDAVKKNAAGIPFFEENPAFVDETIAVVINNLETLYIRTMFQNIGAEAIEKDGIVRGLFRDRFGDNAEFAYNCFMEQHKLYPPVDDIVSKFSDIDNLKALVEEFKKKDAEARANGRKMAVPMGASNKFFYYTQSGEGAIFDIVQIAVFREEIDKAVLKEAADKALKLFPEFAVRPVIKNGKLYYQENNAPAPVLDEDRVVNFGTDDTNGYQFCLFCKGKELKISVYHAMADAIGLSSYIRTMLYFYLEGKGVKMPADEDTAKTLGIRLSDKDLPNMLRKDVMDPYREFGSASCKPEWTYDNPGAFVVPEPVYGDTENKFRVSAVNLSLSAFLAKTKEYGVSVVPLLATIISRALDKTYDRGGKPINMMLPVNLRTQFDTNTVVNMSDGIMLPVDDALIAASISECAAKLKEIMRAQMTKNTYCSTIAAKTAAVDAFDAKDLFEAAREGSALPPADAWCPVTLALTYPGRMDLPEAYGGLLEDYYDRPLARALGIVGTTFGDSMSLTILQRFDDMRFANAVVAELAALGLDSELVQEGIKSGNQMILEKLERI